MSADHVAVDIPDDAIVEQSPRGTSSMNSDYDDEFFHRVVEDAGRWAFGVIFVEVWVLNETRTHLFRPQSAWWIDPYARDCGENSKFDRLIDPSLSDFLESSPVAPGVGLPGCLWAEVQGGNAANRRRSTAKIDKEGFDTISNRNDLLVRQVTWRDVKPLSEDPDQPHNDRLQFLAECGLGWAAGVPFKVGTNEGLVIYMARESANADKLTDSVNEEYLTHATLLIGSAYSLRIPRRAAATARSSERRDAWRRVKNKIRAMRAMDTHLSDVVHEQSLRPSDVLGAADMADNSSKENVCVGGWNYVTRKIRASTRKFFGAGVQAPPTFTWEQTAWTFFGAFVTLAILTNINKALTENHGMSHSIVLGPFGALMTLQYGLTAAPASQPRNALIGQTIGLLIAHGIGQAKGMEPWLKATLATSLAISAMVKLGVTHPPAGAAALLFSNGKKTWQQVGMMLVGNVVAIICAAIFNNLSDRRQYPTFWGLRSIHDLIFGDVDAGKKKKDK